MTKKLKALTDKTDGVDKGMSKVSNEVGILGRTKNKVRRKNTVTEMRNASNGLTRAQGRKTSVQSSRNLPTEKQKE